MSRTATTTGPSAPARLAAFAAALAVAGLLGAGLGAVVGPLDVGGGHEEAPATTTPTDGHPAPAPTSHDEPGGTHG